MKQSTTKYEKNLKFQTSQFYLSYVNNNIQPPSIMEMSIVYLITI